MAAGTERRAQQQLADRLGERAAVGQLRGGQSIEALVEGRDVLVGRPALLADRGIALPPELEAARADAEASGRTAVAVAWDGVAHGFVEVADTIKPTSARAVEVFRSLGLRPILLTGDNARAAGAVARHTGIAAEDVRAEVLPADKVQTFLANLQSHEDQDKPLSAWITHNLKKGEKLETVAKRYGLTLLRLKQLNGINAKTKVVPGFALLVPGKDAVGHEARRERRSAVVHHDDLGRGVLPPPRGVG